MRDGSAFRWETDDPERSGAGEAHAPLRPKPVVRRRAATWIEAEGMWRATISLWAVTVAESRRSGAFADGIPAARTWEWSAFGRVGHELPRALGCRGFATREAAQLDAEASLARLG